MPFDIVALNSAFDAERRRAIAAAEEQFRRAVAVERDKVMVIEPRPTEVVRFVNGRLSVLDSDVRLFPAVVVTYQFFRATLPVAGDVFGRAGSDVVARRRDEMNAIVQFALATLRDNSPVGSGKDRHPGLYRDSHTVFINGVAADGLAAWRPGDEIVISNPVAYARILEVGDSRHRIPHHTYELAAQTVERKFGDIARIEFTYMPLRQSGDERQPALIIKGLD